MHFALSAMYLTDEHKASMNKFRRASRANLLPLAGVCLGLIATALLSLASFSKIDAFQANARWVDHTHQVRFDLEQTAFAVSDAQAAVRGFLVADQTDFLVPYHKATRTLPTLVGGLNALVRDNPDQHQKMTALSRSIDEFMAMMGRILITRQAEKNPEAAFALVANGSGDRALSLIRLQIEALQNAETHLLQAREQQLAQSIADMRNWLILGTSIVFVLFGGAFWLLSREISRSQRADAELSIANATLLNRAEELERTNKELESFSYSISHDLRIPLRAVSGYSSMLAEDYEHVMDDEGKRLLKVIRDNSKQMGVLIDDLLAFSRLGRQALSATEIDMHALAGNVLNEVRDQDLQGTVGVIIDEIPISWGDRALLRQVWTNLISNALKYSSKNPDAQVHISGVSDKQGCTYTVRDNGAGFDMAYYNKLFGVFQRLHSADEFSGTGVGLAIAHRIIVRHGGRIWAEGAVGQGATFFFTLPHRVTP
jgi:signal transduction histidine kinase